MPIPPVRAAVRNRRLLRTIVAALAFDIAEWAVWVGVLVEAYDRGGAVTAGFAAIGLLVPSALAAPIAGVLADGTRPERVLLLGYSVEAALLVGAAVASFASAPLPLVIALVAGALAAVTFARPSTAVVVPGLVSSPSELTAANLLGGWCDSASVLLGPLAAAALLAVDSTRAVFAFCAALTLVAAIATLPLARRDGAVAGTGRDVDTDRATGPTSDSDTLEQATHETRRALASLIECIRGLSRRPASLMLLVVLGGQYVLIGALDLVYVVLAVDLLELGGPGTGYLSASFGAGSLLGGIAATVLVGRRRLAPVLLACLVTIAASMLLLGAFTTVVTAFVLIPVAGVGRALLDLTGRMLMQRVAPQDTLASVFAAVEGVACIGLAAGAILAQTLVATLSERAALLGIGAVFVVIFVVAMVSPLRDIDSIADAPVVTIRLLRSIGLFAPLGGPALEALARSASSIEVGRGDVVIQQGDVGDRYYAIVAGSFEVAIRSGPVRTMVRGSGFGEVALVADVPRTATVVAATDGTLIGVDRGAFLTAVTGHEGASRAAWRTTQRYVPELAGGDSA